MEEGQSVTEAEVEQAFVKLDFHCYPEHRVTVCLGTMANGYVVIGTSACADPRMFSEEIGKNLAQVDAERQAWAYLGYDLRHRLNHIANLGETT